MLPARFLDIAASAALRVFGGDAVAAAEFLAGDPVRGGKRKFDSGDRFLAFLRSSYSVQGGAPLDAEDIQQWADAIELESSDGDMTRDQLELTIPFEYQASNEDLSRLLDIEFRKNLIEQYENESRQKWQENFKRFVGVLITDFKSKLSVDFVVAGAEQVMKTEAFRGLYETFSIEEGIALLIIAAILKITGPFANIVMNRAKSYKEKMQQYSLLDTQDESFERAKKGPRLEDPSPPDSADDHETRKENALALAMQRNGGMFALRVKDPGTGKTWVYKAPDGQPDSISDNYYTEDDDDDDGSGDSSSSPSSPSSESDGESSDNSADGSVSDRLPKLEKVTVKEEPEDTQQEPVNTDPTLVVSSWVDTADRAVTPDIPVTKNRRKRDKEGKRDKENKKNKKSKKGSRRDREKPDATSKDWKLGSREAIYPYLKMLGFYSTLPQYGFDATTRNFADVGALSAMGIKGFSKTSLAENTLGAASSTFRGAQKAFALLKPFELASIPLPPVPERIRLFNTFFHPTEMGNVAYYKRAIARVADGEEAYQAAAQSDDYLEYSRPEQISVNELNFARNILETNFTVRPVERSSGGDQRAAAALVLARGDVEEAFRLMTLNEM